MNDLTKKNTVDFKNPEGYADPTAYQAIKNIDVANRDNADVQAYRTISLVLRLLDLMGYTLVDRLHIKDRVTGREYN